VRFADRMQEIGVNALPDPNVDRGAEGSTA
jgi:hypothetical protein